jgi:hypothetical protein
MNELIEKRNKFFVQLEKFLTDPSDMIREKVNTVSFDKSFLKPSDTFEILLSLV